MFCDLDYHRLKKSLEYFAEHYASAELTTSGHCSLGAAIADFVEGTQDFCRERVSEIDRDLQSRDAYTLSFLRQRLTRSLNDLRTMNPRVDRFFKGAKTWRSEFEQLRKICLDCHLTEELKWAKPCYTYQESNIVLIPGFKDYCALLFLKGALLKDPKGILVQQTENVQAARQIRFTNVREVVKAAPTLKTYIKEAIEVEKAGLEVSYKKTSEFVVPEEFQRRLDKSPALKKAFAALTPGRQRGYILYFSAAKHSTTRQARVQKCVQQILNGKGLND